MSFVFNVDYKVLTDIIGLNEENIKNLINKTEIPNNDELLKNIFEGGDIKDVQALNQYLLTVKSKPIGEGSYNKVYKITINDKNYILRITKTAQLTKHNKIRHMMKEYIGQLIQSTLDHNNIPKVYCIGYTSNDAQNGEFSDLFSKTLSSTITGEEIFCIMEYIEGQELFHYINNKKVLLNQTKIKNRMFCRKYMYDIADALSYLHSDGFAHRDIKIENILITKDNKKAYLIDFGDCVCCDDSKSEEPQRQTFFGPCDECQPLFYLKKYFKDNKNYYKNMIVLSKKELFQIDIHNFSQVVIDMFCLKPIIYNDDFITLINNNYIDGYSSDDIINQKINKTHTYRCYTRYLHDYANQIQNFVDVEKIKKMNSHLINETDELDIGKLFPDLSHKNNVEEITDIVNKIQHGTDKRHYTNALNAFKDKFKDDASKGGKRKSRKNRRKLKSRKSKSRRRQNPRK